MCCKTKYYFYPLRVVSLTAIIGLSTRTSSLVVFGFVLHLALNPQRGVLFRVWFSLVLEDWSLLSTLLFFQMSCEIVLVSIRKMCLYLLCRGHLSITTKTAEKNRYKK